MMSEVPMELLETLPLEECPFVVVDVETTGMSPVNDRITEIAMIKVQGGSIVEEFSTLVNPLVTIPHFITDLTGIDNTMVQDAPTAREVIPYAVEFLGSGVFTAHNASFDWGFVRQTALRERAVDLRNPQLCTVRLTRRIFPALPSKSLGPVARHLNISIPQRHRASGDAYATARILLTYLPFLAGKYALRTAGDLLRYQRSPGITPVSASATAGR